MNELALGILFLFYEKLFFFSFHDFFWFFSAKTISLLSLNAMVDHTVSSCPWPTQAID